MYIFLFVLLKCILQGPLSKNKSLMNHLFDYEWQTHSANSRVYAVMVRISCYFVPNLKAGRKKHRCVRTSYWGSMCKSSVTRTDFTNVL